MPRLVQLVMDDNIFFKFNTIISIFGVDITISKAISIHLLVCTIFNK